MKTNRHVSRPTITSASSNRTVTPARTLAPRRPALAASAAIAAAACRGKVPSVPVSSRATCGVQVKRKLSVSVRAGRLPNDSVAAKREKTETAKLATVTSTLATRIRSKSRRSTSAASRATTKRMQAASGVDTAFGCAVSQEREKAELERRVVELVSNVQNKQTEIANLKMEIGRMKDLQHSRNEMVLLEVENLRAENTVLRQRLEELGPPINEAALCDSDKVILLQKKCNSAPPSLTGSHVSPPLCGPGVMESRADSIGMDQLDAELRSGATGGGDMDRAPSDRGSLEWDKQSNSSVSEMSVACLQDRILQMEETHYSTSEELQATLQELSDMQDQLAELQTDNERLSEEKGVILESLCKQTMRLEEYKVLTEDLRQMLKEQSSEGPSDESQRSERERRLVELAANVEKEKDRLTRERSELMQALRAADTEVAEQRREAAIASEKARLALNDAEELRRQRKAYFESRGGKMAFEEQAELARLQEILDKEKAEVAELLKGQMQGDGAELVKLLDGATQVEKDNIEAAHTVLQGQLMQFQSENERLHEQLHAVQKESAVTVNKLEARFNECQMKLEEATAEKKIMQHELLALQQEYRDMERRCEHHLEDRRDLRATISDLQKKLNEASGRVETLDRQLDDVRRKRDTETKEWEQFQNDLLMTVRVANDFKTEAQQDVEKLVVENATLRDRVKSLQAENERLKAMKTTTSPPGERRIMTSSPTASFPRAADIALVGVDPEAVSLRRTRAAAARAGDNRQSVRSLIESIENASKPSKEDAAGTTSPPTSPVPQAILSPVAQRANVCKNERGPNRPTSIDDTLLSRDPTATQQSPPARSSLRNSYAEGTRAAAAANVAPRMSPENVLPSPPNVRCTSSTENGKSQSPKSIMTNKLELIKRGSYGDAADKKDPLAILAKGGGSKRNALLKWCQNKTVGYKGIDITNFSSSWNDGLALCALLHTYLPNKIPYEELDGKDKRRNFTLAFGAAESVGIPTILNIGDMISVERPDWQSVMCYVTSIYKIFEM